MHNEPQQNPRPLRLVFYFLILVLFTFTGCSGKSPDSKSEERAPLDSSRSTPSEKDEKKTNEKKPEQALVLSREEIQTASIKIQKLALRERPEQIVVTATIQANQDKLARVGPRTAGRVVKVNASLGDHVKTGQTLALLDSIELGEARSSYLQVVSEARLAQSNFERARRLNSDNIIPEKDYLRAQAEREKTQASLRTAAEKLRLLGVSPTQSSGSVFPLSAPFAGTIIEKKAVLGELAAPDASLFTVADLSTLWIEGDLLEKDLSRAKVGAQATVLVTAYPGQVFEGRLTYISSVMNKETRTAKARVEVPNSDGKLKPEMFASVAINTRGTSTKILIVPETAVLLVQGQATVFVAGKSGFEPRAVEVGEHVLGFVTLKSGVTVGEDVVVAGAYAIKARLLKSQISAE